MLSRLFQAVFLSLLAGDAQCDAQQPEGAPNNCLGVQRFIFQQGSSPFYLAIEVLEDDVLHFEASQSKKPPASNSSIYITQMVDSENYASNYKCGPSLFTKTSASSFKTAALQVTIDLNSLSINVFDLILNTELTVFSFAAMSSSSPQLHWKKGATKAVYGVAADFGADGGFGSSNGNWVGNVFRPPRMRGQADFNSGNFGNAMKSFEEHGAACTVQMPVAYSVGDNGFNYAFFLDNVYQHNWYLNSPSGDYYVDMLGTVRFFVFQGSSLVSLRQKYMKLVGSPKLPSKSYFGLQHSLFGFKSFEEMFRNVKATRDANIPIDGMLLDFYWFGGVTSNSDNTMMGELVWDQKAFPDPTGNVKKLRDSFGVGVTLIEEPLVGKNTKTYSLLQNAYALARSSNKNAPDYLAYNGWWGYGGLVDYTSPGADLWMDCKRCALLQDCTVDAKKCAGQLTSAQSDLVGVWTDLGDPEQYNDKSTYWGYPEEGVWKTGHADVHNIYQLLASKSVYDGYIRNHLSRRPTNHVRSGAPGIQRYGITLWSGDLSSYMPVLGNHFGAQKHLIMAGIDFYGSDVGGFNRQASWERGIDQNSTYSQWLTLSSWMDVPLRPHAGRTPYGSLNSSIQTNPAWVGDVQSNAFNIIQRYRLVPFYYSLAHRANLFNLPVFSPMIMAFQRDPNVWSMGDQFMLGEAFLIKLFTGYTTSQTVPSTSVYLPQGEWYNYHSAERTISPSTGTTLSVPLTRSIQGNLIQTAPVFVKSGSIVPTAWVDNLTMNTDGKRKDGSSAINAFIVKVWPAAVKSSFDAIDDDGVTQAYLSGSRTTTTIEQILDFGSKTITVTIRGTIGDFPNAPSTRQYGVDLVIPPNLTVTAAQVNGQSLPIVASISPVQGTVGIVLSSVTISSLSPSLSTRQDKVFSFQFNSS